MAEIMYATAEDDAEIVPSELRCVWPGCTRRRAPERTAGSGRQKEYCLKADRPETGGGPVHNARNRWAWRRTAGSEGGIGEGGDGSVDGSDATAGAEAVNGAEAPASVRDIWPVSTAKNRAADLLEQARRQHSAALASLRAERELYEQLGEQFRVMSDPAALDLEISAIGLKAGRDVSQAGEEAARARRAQLRAERERAEALRLKEQADAAAEQFAADTELAERTLAERAGEFERDRDLLLRRVREAGERADRVTAAAEAAKAAATAAEERADAQAERARQQAADAAAGARRQIAEARDRAAEQVAAAHADAERARAESERARGESERARASADKASTDAERARADAEAIREALSQTRDDAQARITAAETSAATANARADIIGAENERLRAERAEEIARLQAAHQAALDAERARAKRAEDELGALRADAGR